MVSDYAISLKEILTHYISEEYDLEVIVWEAYEIVKSKIEADGGSTMETGPRGSEDAKEEASLHTADRASRNPSPSSSLLP